jgi:hypothetical protein
MVSASSRIFSYTEPARIASESAKTQSNIFTADENNFTVQKKNSKPGKCYCPKQLISDVSANFGEVGYIK